MTFLALLWLQSNAFGACPEPLLLSAGPADVAQLAPAVVKVVVPGGSGSGFFVDPGGLVVTAAHVVGRDGASVVLSSGLSLPARQVRVDAALDLALLDVEGSGFPCLALRDDSPAIGDDVWALGFPSVGLSLSRGIVSAFPSEGGRHFLQTDAALNPGNSGGPFVDGEGRVMGVASWKVVGAAYEGMGYAVPSDELGQWLANAPPEDQARENGPTSEPRLTVVSSPLGVRTAAGESLTVGEFARLIGQLSVAEEYDRVVRRHERSLIWTLSGAAILAGPGIYYGTFLARAPVAAPQFAWAAAGETISLTLGTSLLGHGLVRRAHSRDTGYGAFYGQTGLGKLVDAYNSGDAPGVGQSGVQE